MAQGCQIESGATHDQRSSFMNWPVQCWCRGASTDR